MLYTGRHFETESGLNFVSEYDILNIKKDTCGCRCLLRNPTPKVELPKQVITSY